MAFRINGLRVRSIGLALLLCLSVGRSSSQQAAPLQAPPRRAAAPKTGPYRIAGRIVSSLDGHALPRATVRISDVRSRRLLASTLSGDSGEFAFEDLAPAKYALTGETSGFISAAYDEHEQFSTAIVTGPGLETTSLLLRLVPAATLSGRVLDEYGDGVRAAQVTLYREGHDSGRTQISSVNSIQTNDLGDYAFASLIQGNYYVAAKAVPWYAMHPQPSQAGGESVVVTGVDPALDVAYPITFYPDVTDQEFATPMAVKGGSQPRIDLHLKPVRAARLTIHTVPGEQVAYPQLQMSVFGAPEGMMGQMGQMQTASSSTTEIVGLPPGRYQMMQSDPKTGSVARIRTVDLANGSADLAADGGDETGTVTVTLEDESGVKLPAQMQVVIRGTTASGVQGQAVNEKSEVAFAGLHADDYHFQVYGANHAFQVVQIKEAGKATSNDSSHRLHVAGGETAVTLVISAAVISVEGVVKQDGKPAAGAMVLLVPVDAIKNAELFRRDQSDLDGTFSLLNVGAGRYIVLAISDGWKLDWSRAEVLSRYLVKGVALEIPASQRNAVQLPEVLIAQPR